MTKSVADTQTPSLPNIRAAEKELRTEATGPKKRKLTGAYLEGELIRSQAWLTLKTFAPLLYPLFLARLKKELRGKGRSKKWVITNSQELVFPYREAEEKFRITQPRFTRAIDELVDHGFLDIVLHGNGVAKEATLYGISERWRKKGTPDFEARSRVRVKRGFCRTRKPSANQTKEATVCGLSEQWRKHRTPDSEEKPRLKEKLDFCRTR